MTTPSGLPADYEDDPERFAANVQATNRYSRVGDVHPTVARRLAELSAAVVLDLGGGTGTLAHALHEHGVRPVVIDRAAHVHQAPRPAIRADLRALPFGAGVADAAAALWVLYHLHQPREALAEIARVLRPGGWFVAATSARTNDPELADVLPNWGQPGTFDAENAGDLVSEVFTDVTVEAWDAPLVHIPDLHAAELFLRGRGLSKSAALTAAPRLEVPLDITKRGAMIWARRT